MLGRKSACACRAAPINANGHDGDGGLGDGGLEHPFEEEEEGGKGR